ncbi:DNA internalization-related competence protein ComEC/Rec2 [Vibrio sp. S11_S32]|uniref:DNA internalization-related competence protein ComEC/Rec2 n=1 Tax=Vibrio sp. S11_S32 TaxID=2720225 RepID=UPI00168188D6|nr:DNA internalization-related competence protein ComEC/Rec2 [Vibrio sp. S11_S32]MBD1576768.1 DNA internalization-related competence protein ComEC/Rec2 [Vibrio sp. S11_S32]
MAHINRNWNWLCFILTVASGALWPWMPTGFWLVPIVFLFIIISLVHSFKWGRGIILGCLIVVLQANYFSLMTHTLFQSGENISIKGQITDFFKPQEHGGRLILRVEQINQQQLAWWSSPKINVFLPQTPTSLMINSSPQLGEQWQFKLKVKPIIGRLNQAGFDSEQYYVANGWHAKAVVDASHAENKRLKDSGSLRNTLHKRVKSMITDLASQPYLLALSFGDRSLMSAQDWQWLRDSGLSHLMAISGLHIGLAFFIGWWLGKRVMSIMLMLSRFDRLAASIPYLFAICCAGSYAYLAGFSLPTERAFIFGLCFLLRHFLHAHWSLWQVLLYSLAIILIIQPFAVLLASFWLSFSAVIVIYLCSWFWLKAQSTRYVWAVKMINIALLQCGLFIGLMAITIFIFGGFSWVSPMVNIVIIPWVSLCTVPLIFMALVMSALVEVGVPLQWGTSLWQWADWSLSWVIMVMQWVQGSWLLVSELWAYGALILMMSLLMSHYCGWYRSAVVFMVLFVAAYFGTRPAPKWQVEILDVGQGLAILIGQQDKWLLYDTGNKWQGGSMAQSVILPILRQQGISQLDGFIVSHFDSDHAGGRDIIEQQLQPKWQRSSQQLTGYLPCVAGEVWQWKDLTFNAIWPPRLVNRAYNPHSCVIQITDGQYSVLLTGDIDAIAEMIMARKHYPWHSKLKSDVMIVPHHGSKTSSTASFVQQVNPEIAIASLARNNQWGLPNALVKQQYQKLAAKWLDTGEQGQISLRFNANNWSVRSLRQQQYSPWYRQIVRKGLE